MARLNETCAQSEILTNLHEVPGYEEAQAGGGGAVSCRFLGTFSPITATVSQGKKPTSKPLLPRHHTLSTAGGMSITEIISPTCIQRVLMDNHALSRNTQTFD
jgi:hypothetical protein